MCSSSVTVQLHGRNKCELSSLKTSISPPSPHDGQYWSTWGSFTWYHEDSLTYIVFVYWIIKKKTTGTFHASQHCTVHKLDLVSWFCCISCFIRTVMVLELRADGTRVFVLCCILLVNRSFFFCLFVFYKSDTPNKVLWTSCFLYSGWKVYVSFMTAQ